MVIYCQSNVWFLNFLFIYLNQIYLGVLYLFIEYFKQLCILCKIVFVVKFNNKKNFKILVNQLVIDLNMNLFRILSLCLCVYVGRGCFRYLIYFYFVFGQFFIFFGFGFLSYFYLEFISMGQVRVGYFEFFRRYLVVKNMIIISIIVQN